MSGKSKIKIKIKQKPTQLESLQKSKISSAIPKWLPLAVLTITALIYVKSLFNGFVNWDDDQYILNNPYITDFSLNGIKTIFSTFYFGNYHPLTTLTYLFEFKFFGLNPFAFHLTNAALHILNCWLVFKFTENLSKKKTALIVMILFAVHPMHVESVAWIAERKDVLYAMFYLLSLLAYLKYLNTGRTTKYYVFVLFFFICSLFSKSAAVTLPVLFIAIDIYKKRKINLKLFLEKIPFILLSILFGILAILSQNESNYINDLSIVYSIFERILLFTYTIAFYILKLILPYNLSAVHYFPDTQGDVLPWKYFASIPFLLLIVWLIKNSGKLRRDIIFGVSFFLISISVMLQIIPVGNSITSERYTYIPYIGLFYIIGQFFTEIVKKQYKNIAIVFFSIIIVAFSFQTWSRISLWKNGEVLFSDVIKNYPNSYHGYLIRGYLRDNNGNLQGALQDYNKAIELNPKFADSFVNRGIIRDKLNDYNGAMQDLCQAIKLDSTIAKAYINRGGLRNKLNDYKGALQDLNFAIKLDSTVAEAFNNRAISNANIGNIDDAMRDLNNAILLDPTYSDAYSNRGNAKTIKKDYNGAIEDYNFSIKLKPENSEAYYNLGNIKILLNDTMGACDSWKKSNKLGSNKSNSLINQYCH